MHEAMFYTQGKSDTVTCSLCCHRCTIQPGHRGLCGVRENREGRLFSLVYGLLVAEHIDPIEKKPLFHFLPGSRTYSISTVGCNFRCLHCQNFEISQYPHMHDQEIIGKQTTPEEVVALAEQKGCTSISYTYVEPTVFFEYSRRCAELARQKKICNVYVSNGYMTPEAARDIAPFLDAINIDIKAFTDSFYKKVCKARLQPVLDNVLLFHELGVWVEVTTLIIPGLNDSDEELKEIAAFIYQIDPALPWHVSAFYPTYKMMDRPRTSPELLRKAYRIGKEAGLHHVYQGNIPGEGEDTFCPECGAKIIERNGFLLQKKQLIDGKCEACQAEIRGVWR
ncbi:AmmeMemoRadiSam system radical SAM enzyme [Desulfogranum marinum]|uniref:AmmeMemoRadiSam system radical SAM enzyme n=1 Tax=Desulfogranum marinum TaxID=453220 RepID=UPI0019664861|nr:AmmeMemoRadiSam system radical SAM enzyme [Desulfogranum marinum]MBM9511960.1 AmmeMemoRadiSam system radical SAM enzyme [Desulfogranum marinum]